MAYLRLSCPKSAQILLLIAIFVPCSLALQLCGASDGTQYNGSYTDGSGIYITSDDVTKPYEFPLIRKCWYEYYLLNSSLYYAPWRKSSGDINCAGTSACSVSSLNGTEFCQTRTATISTSVSLSDSFFKASFGYVVTLSAEGCYSATNADACEWDDGDCHSVWTQQQLVKQVGYKRQICNDGNKLDNDKLVTKCMADFETDTPTTITNYGCGAQCDAQYNGTVSTSSSSLIATTIMTSISSSTVSSSQVTTSSASSTLTSLQSTTSSAKATSTATHAASKSSGSSLFIPFSTLEFRGVISVIASLAILLVLAM